MATTATQWQQAIIKELNSSCGDCGNVLSSRMPFLWTTWADKALISDRLQYLYAKRSAIDFLLGQSWTKTNSKLGPLENNCADVFQNLLKLRELINADIETEESLSVTMSRSSIGELETTAPVMADDYCPDPNARKYRGDPLLR